MKPISIVVEKQNPENVTPSRMMMIPNQQNLFWLKRKVLDHFRLVDGAMAGVVVSESV